MHVFIRYTERYGPAPGGAECIAMPFESGISKHRACFCELPGSPGTWALSVGPLRNTVKANDDLEPVHSIDWAASPILPRNCPSREDYLAWVADNVELVEVDGHPFWPAAST